MAGVWQILPEHHSPIRILKPRLLLPPAPVRTITELFLRVPVVNVPDQGYLCGYTCDGRYSLRRWNGEIQPKGEMKRLVDLTASSAIKTGSNRTNRLGIYAVGSRLILYVNGTLLTEVNKSTYPSGYFGVFVGADVTTNLTVHVDEMSYWLNPKP